MGQRNFLIEGISGTGKTSVCDELVRRGYHALHGDRELRPDANAPDQEMRPTQGTMSGIEAAALRHTQAFWDKSKVLSHIHDCARPWSFFCGGFRNHAELIQHFDGVFILEVDRQTLLQRLEKRPHDEFGGTPAEREFILGLHKTKADIPKTGLVINATTPIKCVVDEIIEQCGGISAPS